MGLQLGSGHGWPGRWLGQSPQERADLPPKVTVLSLHSMATANKVLGLYFGLWLTLSICLTFFSQVPIFRPFGFFFFAVCPQESSSTKTLFRCRNPKADPRAVGADLGKQSFFFFAVEPLGSAEEEGPKEGSWRGKATGV